MSNFVPIRINYRVPQGADWSRCILLKDPNDPTGATPLPLPWDKGRLLIAEDYGMTPVLELTTENGGLVFDKDAGQIKIVIDEDDTAPLPLYGDAGAYVFDLFAWTDVLPPDTDKVAYGGFTIFPQLPVPLDG
jgi:hypothetical protein